ncbi:MAG: type IIL restriction-modification enzyme MmeI, partial [Dermabacter sp.]|nr:type IIL restriction-modification enzyme MmeI [Dermabacter sp.]
HQANQALSLALGYAVPMLPLADSANIKVGNALKLDWKTVIPPSRSLRVIGNPPFLGDHTRSAEQLEELKNAWGGNKQLSRMDYVTGWHAKTLDLFSDTEYQGEWAYVTTNSITQGDQVPRLFEPIKENGWQIKFAHRTFSWSSEAPGAAAVHCVIIGFTQNHKVGQRLFDYPSVKGHPVEIPIKVNINPYLLDARNILVEKRSTALSPELNLMEYGSKATDDGNLIVEPEDYEVVMADPIASRYVHKYIGARELLHRESRWCLWLEDATHDEINDSPILRSRVQAVQKFRQSSQARSTRDYPYPHLFRQLAKQSNDFVCVPRVVSENRKYFTVAHLDHSVICSDSVFQCSDPDGFQFSILSSAMFVTWQKAIGGRLKSDLRFASTLTWYTFPLPAVGLELRERIIDAGKEILVTRSLHPEWSLAEHYKEEGLTQELERAHAKLDLAVDEAFGAQGASLTDSERVAVLFDNYSRMVAAE